jgi:predicted ATPase
MLETVTLSQWMPSRWATIETAGDNVKKRVSTWPKDVADVVKGDFVVSHDTKDQIEEKKSAFDDKVYYQNAVVVAYLLVQHIMGAVPSAASGNGSDKLNVDPNSIKVIFTVEEESSSLEDVSAVLHPSTGTLRPIFYSLGEVLLNLFSRQETITPECRAALMSRQENLYDRREGESCETDTFDSFQDTMQRALLFLDLEEGGGDTIMDDLYELPENRCRTITPSTFSIICTNYPTLPMSVCRFIADVMEGTNGGFALTKTSFTSLEEVLEDLKRMMFEPDIFLHNPSDPKIDFGKRLYGREEEISVILSVAECISSRQGSGTLEIIGIHGYSGSGKSFLANQIGRYLSTKGWIFLEGKFDRMRQGDAAFSMMMSALENFFCTMANDVIYYDQVATKVREALGQDGVDSLSRVIPSLNKLVGDEMIDIHRVDSDGMHHSRIVRTGEESAMYEQRIEYLLCVLVDAILSVGRPILLLYDSTTQWARLEESRFLQHFLMHIADQTSSRKNILFIECCDKKESEGLNASMIASHDSVNITRIEIGEFSKPALNDAISHALHLPPRVTSPLSEIIHIKTMGNIMFVLEFMKSLEKSKMLTYNLSERQWVWDTDIVPLQRISDSVAGLLMSKLLNLDKNVLDCLIMASCFGSQINMAIMDLLDGLRGVTHISNNLDLGVEEGILEKAGPLYMFSHNSLQHTVYEITPKNKRNQLHLDIGSTLISKSASAPQEVIEELFSVALSHINRILPENGQPNEINLSPSQRSVFAKLNLKAGQKAINTSADFALARFHLKAGMAFLPETCWHDQYELAFNLHFEYANVLLVQHEYKELDAHCKALLLKSRCIENQIKIHELLIAYLFQSGKFPEALEHVRSVLDTLGFPLPTSVDTETVRTVLEAMRNAASGFTPEQMHAFPLMTEEVPKQAMKIMGSVPILLTFSSPTFAAMIACQMAQLSIQHGLCAESAVAFGNLGFAINSVLQDFNCGYDMCNLGLAIFQRFKSNTLILKTYVPIFGFGRGWKVSYSFLFLILCIMFILKLFAHPSPQYFQEPLQSCAEGLNYAIHEGSLAGDRGSV